MFKSKRMKELEKKEVELERLKLEIMQIKHWCAADSPEIGFAMKRLEDLRNYHESLSEFRDDLRKGKFTFEAFKRSQQ